VTKEIPELVKLELRATIASHFRPSAPVESFDLFAGRTAQIRDVVATVMQPGRHAMIFGERGVGKTSLVKVSADFLSQGHTHFTNSGTINCDQSDDFDSIWRKVFRELEVETRMSVGMIKPTQEMASLDSLIPEGERIRPDDIRYLLSKRDKPVVIILDEVDRIQDASTTAALADTIKNLSDHASPVTLILVGVADAVDELVREHRSIERAIAQIHMPRMTMTELSQIIDNGLKAASMMMDQTTKYTIAHLSRGLPHYTHLLGLYAANYAIDMDRLYISTQDVMAVIGEALKSSHSIWSAYDQATASPQAGNLYKQVLLACALAPCNDLGYFPASAVKDPLSRIMNKPYEIPAFTRHLNDFSNVTRGTVLNKKGEPRRYRFRFRNPLMQPFVILQGLDSGMLTQDMIATI
jgi:Cdc6-like AAA superfamily ATPase